MNRKIGDICDFFIQAVKNLITNELNLLSPLEEVVIKSAGKDLAYIDGRRDAKEEYDFDFWEDAKSRLGKQEFTQTLKNNRIRKKTLYSNSWEFPDFLFKTRMTERQLTCGSLLELKDSDKPSVASFNSTFPTRTKTLDEIDVINGDDLVSKLVQLIDEKSSEHDFMTYERRCFYLVRTHKKKPEKVKISLVDGSFFETVPKDSLIYQTFLQILHDHIEKKELQIAPDVLEKVESVLSKITDQRIIAASRTIQNASIKPRFRIMAEVHSEGNPHSSHYPEIHECTFNLILKSQPAIEEIKEQLIREIPELKLLKIEHKRNGEHTVFQFRINPQTLLQDFQKSNG